VTARRTGTLNVDELAALGRSTPGVEGDDR